MQLTYTLTYSATVDELISYPNRTTPLPVHPRLNQSVPPSGNWRYFGGLDEQVDITVAHLHFMAHCRRLAALIRVACLWLEARGPTRHICHVFCFLQESWGRWFYTFSTEIWLSQKINSLLNLPFIIFDRLDPPFLCLCLVTLVTNPIPNIPTRALRRLCSRYICLLFWPQLVCVKGRRGLIVTSG